MEIGKSIEISFGAFDSELKGWEYTIPEGMEAEIKNGKIIVREKESEDERIRKEIISYIKSSGAVTNPNWINWLEKQGSQNLANSEKTCKIEQKPTWSDEDIKTIERIVCILDGMRYYNTVDNKQEKPYQSEIDWLKSIKDRFNVNNEKEK